MLKRLTVVAAVGLFLTWGTCQSTAHASTSKPPLVVRIVNVQEIMARSTAVTGLRQQLDSYRAQYDAEFVVKEKKLQNGERELVKQKTLLTPDAYREKVQAFRKDVGSFQKNLKMRLQKLDAAYTFSLSKVTRQIKKIWLDVAQKERATLVLRSADVLMFSPEYDVTDEVVDRLNKALPTVEFPNPETFGVNAKKPNK